MGPDQGKPLPIDVKMHNNGRPPYPSKGLDGGICKWDATQQSDIGNLARLSLTVRILFVEGTKGLHPCVIDFEQ